MKNRKLLISFAFLFSLGLSDMHGQSILNIKENSGINTSYYIRDIRKLTFSGGNMTIEKKDKSSNLYGITGIKNLNFSSVSTVIDTPVFQSVTKTYLFPNPIKEHFYIERESNYECNMMMEIADIQGKILREQLVQLHERINVADLHNGLYICRIKSCDQVEIIKFIKQ